MKVTSYINDRVSDPAASEEDLRYALGLFETYGKDASRRADDGGVVILQLHQHECTPARTDTPMHLPLPPQACGRERDRTHAHACTPTPPRCLKHGRGVMWVAI